MTGRSLFVTRLWESRVDDARLLDDLAHAMHALADQDTAGRAWSRAHRYPGYTSYASLNDLPRRDPAFAALGRLLSRQATRFAEDCGFALDRKLRLDSLWANVLKGSGHHGAHIHPHSAISGTLYVDVPPGAGAIRFEDPRLPMMMAAPVRDADAPADRQTFVTVTPTAGTLLMWESWLRHEVMPGSGRGDRLSISFNFA